MTTVVNCEGTNLMEKIVFVTIDGGTSNGMIHDSHAAALADRDDATFECLLRLTVTRDEVGGEFNYEMEVVETA